LTLEEVERVWMCGYSGRDDTLPTAHDTDNSGPITDQEILDKAIAAVRAAGFRVSKPKTPKHKNRIGPAFVCKFADDTITRMTTATSLENLDWGRGVRLARHAWASRHKAPPDWGSAKLAEIAPSIIACGFEQDGKVLAQRNGGSAP
jgi:hypothetical protein